MMRRMLGFPTIAAVAAIALSAAACSKANSGSPVAPSAPAPQAVATPAPVAGGASISGTLVGGSASALAAPAGFATLGSVGRVTVSVTGTSISVVSEDGTFTLTNVPPGDITLSITGAGVNALVPLPGVGMNDQLRITVRVEGTSAQLEDKKQESTDKVEIEGIITAATGMSSTGGTIVVGRDNTSVFVPAAASITKGSITMKPNDLTVGLRVHVRATKAGAALTATVVLVQNTSGNGNGNGRGNGGSGDDSDDDDDDDANEAEITGTVTGAPTTGCPLITFYVGTTKVTTTASTTWDDVTCATLASGDSVKVEGAKQPDGSIVAKEVEKRSGTTTGNTGKASGTVTEVGGTCPDKTFKLGSTKVKTASSTTFEGLSCATLTNGVKVEVTGTKGADGVVLASAIEKRN